MATTEHNGAMTFKDANGNLYILYPVTQAENVLMANGDILEEVMDQKANEWVATTSGNGKVYTVTLDPAPTELYAGMTITIIPHVASENTFPKLNVNGIGEKSIVMLGHTANPHTTLLPFIGYLRKGIPTTLIYDGTDWIVEGTGVYKHDSIGTAYGLGTNNNYGHVRLSDSTTTDSDVSEGIAATPKAVKAAYDLANGKAPTRHKSPLTTYGVGDANNYGHVKLTEVVSDSGNADGVAATPVMVKTVADDLDTHTGNTTVHVTSTEKSTWNGKANASHTHGNVTSDGKIGTAANKAVYTGTNGALQAGTLPVAAGGTGATSTSSAPFLAKTGGTLTGALKVGDTTTWTTGYARNIVAGPAAPTTSTCPLGQIYLQYE